MNIAKELGMRIRYYRKTKHLTQEKLAEICNLHPTYIGQLERGEKNVTIENLYRISKGLNIPISKLLESIEQIDSASQLIPLEFWHKFMALPHTKQDSIQNILSEILNLTN